MNPTSDSLPEVSDIQLRFDALPQDRITVRQIVDSTGFFHADEVDIAVELVEERLLKGESSGYHFIFMERDGRTIAYACFGPIPCTKHSYDLYWIAVHQDVQRLGLGRRLVELSEQRIRELGGQRVYVDTSGREQYRPTRQFYERCGYVREATLTDFYDVDDDKVIYVRMI